MVWGPKGQQLRLHGPSLHLVLPEPERPRPPALGEVGEEGPESQGEDGTQLPGEQAEASGGEGFLGVCQTPRRGHGHPSSLWAVSCAPKAGGAATRQPCVPGLRPARKSLQNLRRSPQSRSPRGKSLPAGMLQEGEACQSWGGAHTSQRAGSTVLRTPSRPPRALPGWTPGQRCHCGPGTGCPQS